MKLFILIYKDDDALEPFLRAVRLEKLTGFTMFPSTGLGRTPQKNVEEFSFKSLAQYLSGDGEVIKNVTLISFISETHLPRLLELLKQHCPDIGQPGVGLYAVLPVDSVMGLSTEVA